MEPSIQIIRGGSFQELASGETTSREPIFESAGAVVARFSIRGRTVSPWHHHAERTLVGYLLSGRLQIEFGRHGDSKISLKSGDAFRIPVKLVHRDSTVDYPEGATVLSVYLGGGPIAIDVGAPDGD